MTMPMISMARCGIRGGPEAAGQVVPEDGGGAGRRHIEGLDDPGARLHNSPLTPVPTGTPATTVQRAPTHRRGRMVAIPSLRARSVAARAAPANHEVPGEERYTPERELEPDASDGHSTR